MEQEISEGMKVCTQCEKIKAEDRFYRIRKPGWKVTYCNDCVAINIAVWRKSK
jgi:hypothetical protein